MASNRLLYLRRDADPHGGSEPVGGIVVEWYDGEGRVARGGLAQAAAAVGAAPVTLVVPGEQLLLSRVTLPGRARGRWRQAVPFALEDRLAESVETLHVAVGPARPVADGTRATPAIEVPTAALREQRLRHWLESAAGAGLRVRSVVPDVLLLPRFDGAWSLLLDGHRCLLRHGPWDGFAAAADALPALLDLLLARCDGGRRPDALAVWQTPGAALPTLPALALRHEKDSVPLALFARGLRQGPVLELLQGGFAAVAAAAGDGRPGGGGSWRQWRFAALLTGLLVGLQGAGLGLDYWRLQRESAALRQSIAEAFHRALPQARRMVDPRAQVAARLRELELGERGGSDFFRLLAVGGQSLRDLADATIELRGLRYQNDRLEFLLSGSELEVFDRLRRQLAGHADVAATLHTSRRDQQVESRLALSRPPS